MLSWSSAAGTRPSAHTTRPAPCAAAPACPAPRRPWPAGSAAPVPARYSCAWSRRKRVASSALAGGDQRLAVLAARCRATAGIAGAGGVRPACQRLRRLARGQLDLDAEAGQHRGSALFAGKRAVRACCSSVCACSGSPCFSAMKARPYLARGLTSSGFLQQLVLERRRWRRAGPAPSCPAAPARGPGSGGNRCCRRAACSAGRGCAPGCRRCARWSAGATAGTAARRPI